MAPSGKLHIDTADGDIPVACVLTSASVHDSQGAIPLATMAAMAVDNRLDTRPKPLTRHPPKAVLG